MIGSSVNKPILRFVQNAIKNTKLVNSSVKDSAKKILLLNQLDKFSTQAGNGLRLFSTSCTKNAADTSAPSSGSSLADKSANKDLFYVEEHKAKGYVVFKLNKAPVNGLNLEFLTELNIQMDKFEQSKDINGVILTSNLPNIFSGGLDINEMYEIKPDRGRQFWTALQDFWIKLYGSNKIYIAAINGHSPAGGCLTAISCDYRIMVKGPYKIGLNETLLGIKAPFWFRDTLINTIGMRESEKALQLGTLYTAEQALAINLVDEIVEPKDLMLKAEEQILKWSRIPSHARQLTKSSMRRDTLNKLLAQREADTEEFVEFAAKDSIQKSLKIYLDSLKKPKQ